MCGVCGVCGVYVYECMSVCVCVYEWFVGIRQLVISQDKTRKVICAHAHSTRTQKYVITNTNDTTGTNDTTCNCNLLLRFESYFIAFFAIFSDFKSLLFHLILMDICIILILALPLMFNQLSIATALHCVVCVSERKIARVNLTSEQASAEYELQARAKNKNHRHSVDCFIPVRGSAV